MFKRIVGGLAAAALLLSLAGTALAHQGWVEPNTPIARVGDLAYVDLLFGNHSNNHASYRIAGKWSMETTRVYVTSPDGTKTDISANVFDTGEPTDTPPPGTKGYYTAAFVPGVPGAYIVSVEGDSIFKHGEVAVRTLRSAKTFVAAADLPLRERVAFLAGFSRPVTPDRAELIPLVSPVSLTPGAPVRIQLRIKGQPAPGQHVKVIRRSTAEAWEYQTDANGVVSFTAGNPDFYLVTAAIAAADERQEGQYDRTTYEATMTFVVHREVPAPAAAAGQPMTILVNGQGLRLDAGTGLPEIANNRTFLPYRAVAEALGATVDYDPQTRTVTATRNGVTVQLRIGEAQATVDGRAFTLDAAPYVKSGRTMVPLRFLAESFGATVEYLPPTAGLGATVLVYLQ
ncbi:MAG: stalk domain-containing protein [Bacillota bacterium]